MLGWAIAAWLVVSSCAIWGLTWRIVVAVWPSYGFIAIVGGVIGLVLGLAVLKMAHEVATS